MEHAWRDLPIRYDNWNSTYHKFQKWYKADFIHDSQPVLDLFVGVDLVGKTILADKAYSTEFIRSYLQRQGAVICIPDKINFKFKHAFDSELYKQRNFIECFFQRIKNCRHIATCFKNFVLLVSDVIHF